MAISKELRDYWEERGIANPELPTVSDLTAFEEKYSVRLPSVLRDYFLLVNGTRVGQWGMEDPDLISFWHLDQLHTLREEGYATAAGARLFVFADWSLDAWSWVVHVPEASSDTRVYITSDLDNPIASTFEEFLGGYLRRESWALYPERRQRTPGRILF
jgi:hypothetical protein